MSFRRHKMLSPIRRDDGTSGGKTQHWLTTEEIVSQFAAAPCEPEAGQGMGRHEGRQFEEPDAGIVADVEEALENEAFLRPLKARRKARFRRIDIWIVPSETRVL